MGISEPIIAPTNAAASLTTQDRLAKFDAELLAHPVISSVIHEAMSLLRRPAIPIIEVVGPTGIGKTTFVKKVHAALLDHYGPAMRGNPGLIPVVRAEAPSPDSGSFHWGDFYKRFLRAAQEPMIENKALEFIDGRSDKKSSTFAELRWSMEQCIRQRGIKVVIIDEAQHLCKVTNARRLQDQMDLIKSLSSLTGVQFVMVGTYELLSLLNQNGQLARRTRCIHFHRYDFEKPDDRLALAILLTMFESRMPVQAGGVLTRNQEYIYERSLGCIGILKDWLRLACNRAVDARRDALTLADLQAAALPEESLLQILAEILEGERSIGGWTQKGDDLRDKLGLKPLKSPGLPLAKAKKPVVRLAVGQRKPTRDPVNV